MSIAIERITLHRVEMCLVEKLVTSFGGQALRPCVIVEVNADGLTGWGECPAQEAPDYSSETVDTVWHVLRHHFGPLVIGQPIDTIAELDDILDRYRGHPMARAGLEAAVWDVLAQAEGKPLADYMHNSRYDAPRRDSVQVGVSIGIQSTVEDTFAIIDKRLDEGYTRIKLKIEPGWDVNLTASTRTRYPDMDLMLDANSAYTLNDAPRLKQLDGFDLMMLEQPLWHDDIWLHSKLQPQLETPLCLDESIHHARDAHFALEIGACQIINVKPGRVSGLHEARQIHDICLEHGASAWVGGMLETGIGRAANLALASLPGFTLPGDISATDRYWEHDITEHFTLNPDGTIDVPDDAPGLGVEIDHDRLAAVTPVTETIVAE